MTLWTRQGPIMRRKAKHEGKIQAYNAILQIYGAEIRARFGGNVDKVLCRFLAEKYGLLYIWPDRADWNEHWEEWFDDERSRPGRAVGGFGLKIEVLGSDWGVFMEKAFALGMVRMWVGEGRAGKWVTVESDGAGEGGGGLGSVGEESGEVSSTAVPLLLHDAASKRLSDEPSSVGIESSRSNTGGFFFDPPLGSQTETRTRSRGTFRASVPLKQNGEISEPQNMALSIQALEQPNPEPPLFFFDPPLHIQPNSRPKTKIQRLPPPPAKTSLEREVDRFLDDLEEEILNQPKTSSKPKTV